MSKRSFLSHDGLGVCYPQNGLIQYFDGRNNTQFTDYIDGNDADLTESNCIDVTSSTYIELSKTVTITNYISDGVVTPSISGTRIIFDVTGQVMSITLSDDNIIVFQAGDGNVVWDVTTTNNSFTITNFSWGKQNSYHYNIIYGCTISGTTLIPTIIDDVGLDVLNNTPTNPRIINGHNGCETCVRQPDVQKLKDADTDNIWFDLSGTPKNVNFTDLPLNIGDYTYGDKLTKQWRYGLLYDPPLIINDANRVFKCYGEKDDGVGAILDIYGDYVIDDNGYVVLTE